jgi:hypothetical protein
LNPMTRAWMVTAGGAGLAAAIGYRYIVSPRLHTWGATPDEVHRPMPGDELVPNPMMSGTRAVTIAAPPEDIWPWLVQIGYGRAGFYSYKAIERLMGLTAISNADRVLSEFQQLTLGDVVPFGPGAALPVVALRENRHLCFAMSEHLGAVTWAFGLYPIDRDHTRLVSRNLGFMPDWTVSSILAHPSRWRTELPMKLFINLGGFVMVRKMLLGIKQRAERRHAEQAAEKETLVVRS